VADGLVKELEKVHPVEAVFVVVTFGFMLDEFAASKEHGWTGEPFLHRAFRFLTNDQCIRLMWVEMDSV
jgi:hypothetical protein